MTVKDFAAGMCAIGEIVCITLITGIALKRNNDCYKAECKLINTEFKLMSTELDNINKDIEIKTLKDKIKKLES